MSDLSPSDGRVAARLHLARAALAWERIWPALWPALAVLAGFVVLALFDVLPMLPRAGHLGALGVFGIALAIAIAMAVRAIAWPDHAAARRRLEEASGLLHRPLQALADRPIGSLDPAMAGLWEAHRRRMLGAVRRLRVGWPAAGLAARDPWGLRAVLAMLLVMAGIDAGADWRDRVARALSPGLGTVGPLAATGFDIWVTPPDYTGLAPQFLQAGGTDTVHVPIGSTLLAQVHGAGGLPRLTIDRDSQPFEAVDQQNFRVTATLRQGKSLAVSQDGSTLGRWPIEIVPDNPPTVAFARPPQATPRAALRLDYRAGDDYGVEGVKAVIRRQGGDPEQTIELTLPLPGLHLKNANATAYDDLSPHPWAGLPVEIRLVASDALGQTGESEPVRMVLPERTFNHPIARAIIDQRKELVKDPNSRDAVAEILSDLNQRPRLYRDDDVVYLALHLAQQLLQLGGDPAAIAAVEQLLWDTALRIEEGSMSLAEREMRRLQQQLQDALARNAPDAEIDQLMRELEQALDRYMQALAEELKRNPSQSAEPVDPSRVITSQDLQRMLDRARELARSGARDQARELLSQLQNMLENLRAGRPGDMRQRGSSEAQQMMRAMRDMMQRQQQLLDRSFRAQRQGHGEGGQQDQQDRAGQRGNQSGGDQSGADDMGDAAGQQEALRRMLGEMMRRFGEGMGEIPEPFGRAERAMRDATGALQRGQPGDAIGPQSDALDQLQQAAREFAQRMQTRRGGPWGDPGDNELDATDGQSQDRVERDPLGRPLPNNGTLDQGDVKIPDQNTLQKARDILDELRRRAGDRSRPEIELDYIERLLKRF
ncbi:MAG: TIGR02302 family protein [Alphaproteobacteria bacterium]|nr:TIGR02302 family protein [Alphaproteobacteria bacterium]MBV9862130.1 TIGR02302 family protein [Alphaproteobacteria bacterium]